MQMKQNRNNNLLFIVVMVSLFGCALLFGWLVGAKSNTNPRNEYNETIESFENDYVNRELDKLNDK